jgi:RNA polymerase sigma-70 factor (ECF subfamily)
VSDDLAATVDESLRNGDSDAAATTVVRALGPQMLSYLRSVLRDSDDSEDTFSLWAEAVWNGIGDFRAESRLETWCYRIAWHSALRLLRDPYRRRREALPASRASQLTAPHLAKGATDGIARLRPQAILCLRVDRDLPWRDEAALRKRYKRIKERIAEMAKAEGLL